MALKAITQEALVIVKKLLNHLKIVHKSKSKLFAKANTQEALADRPNYWSPIL